MQEPDAEQPMRAWYKEAERSDWKSFADVKATFNQTDIVSGRYIFDIGGNKWRIIARVRFDIGWVLIRWVGNHHDYSNLTAAAIGSL
jgi:mRNA interferase HigB